MAAKWADNFHRIRTNWPAISAAPEVAQTWTAALGSLDQSVVTHAITAYGAACKWRPTPADILERYRSLARQHETMRGPAAEAMAGRTAATERQQRLRSLLVLLRRYRPDRFAAAFAELLREYDAHPEWFPFEVPDAERVATWRNREIEDLAAQIPTLESMVGELAAAEDEQISERQIGREIIR